MANTTESSEKVISPLQLARALGLGESTVKRWIDQGRIAALRTAGGHRRIPLREALAFVRSGGFELVDAEALGLALARQTDAESLARLLVSDAPEQAIALFERLYASGVEAAALADDWLAPAMAAVGQAWESEEVGVDREHRATVVAMRALHGLLRGRLRRGPGAAGALVAAPSTDPYVLPILCAELVLSEAGYAAVNLGPDTPLESVNEATRTLGPRIVAISFSGYPPAPVPARVRVALRESIRESGAALVVGGRTCDESLAEGIGATAWCRSMRELARFAQHLAPRS